MNVHASRSYIVFVFAAQLEQVIAKVFFALLKPSKSSVFIAFLVMSAIIRRLLSKAKTDRLEQLSQRGA